MLAIALDLAGAFLVSKYIKNIWAQIFLAVIVGISSSIVSNMLMYAIFSETMTLSEMMMRVIGGIIWHPLIALVALWFFRKKKRAP